MSDQVYNWIVDYLYQRYHYTKQGDQYSNKEFINASVVQGSALGPISYVLTARNLKAKAPGNEMAKYADDTYLLVPAKNELTTVLELDNIDHWAKTNNLTLNRKKSEELIVCHKKSIKDPEMLPGIKRVNEFTVLGVTLQSNLRMDLHIS